MSKVFQQVNLGRMQNVEQQHVLTFYTALCSLSNPSRSGSDLHPSIFNGSQRKDGGTQHTILAFQVTPNAALNREHHNK